MVAGQDDHTQCCTINHTGINIIGILCTYVFSISSMNASDFIVQVWVKIKKLNPSHTLPWMSDHSTIIVEGVGSTTKTVSGKKIIRSDNQFSFTGRWSGK